jgi:hypothetical protein
MKIYREIVNNVDKEWVSKREVQNLRVGPNKGIWLYKIKLFANCNKLYKRCDYVIILPKVVKS